MHSSRNTFQDVLFCPMVGRGVSSAVRRVVAAIGDAHLTVVGVVPEPSRFDAVLHGRAHVEQILEAGHVACERRVSRCVDVIEHERGDGNLSSLVEVGHPALALVTRAIAARHDLIAVAVDDDVDDVMIRRLLRKSPCPVWVIRPTRAQHPRVLAAIDVDAEQRDLNRSIMDTASQLAGPTGELHVVNAWQLFGEATMRSSAFVHVEEDEIEQWREQVRTAHVDAVDDAVAQRGDEAGRWNVHVEEGDPCDVVTGLARRQHATTVVIGTVARSGIEGLVMGNTAERVVDTVRCSLVAIKPPGFVSPMSR